MGYKTNILLGASMIAVPIFGKSPKMAFKNLTPHPINIVTPTGDRNFGKSGTVSRVDMSREKVRVLDGIDIYRTKFGDVEDLPPPKKGVYYIVSGLVAGHKSVRGRDDVFSPGDLIRDSDGRVIGARGLTEAPKNSRKKNAFNRRRIEGSDIRKRIGVSIASLRKFYGIKDLRLYNYDGVGPQITSPVRISGIRPNFSHTVNFRTGYPGSTEGRSMIQKIYAYDPPRVVSRI